jgi:hypothetical protein
MYNLIENGKICKVEFIKKDGSLGVVHGRTGVAKNLKGGSRTTDPKDYIMFYDFKKGYRNVAKARITKINGLGVNYVK